MRSFVCLAVLAAALPASAGTLVIEKQGLVPAEVWVDGVSQGRLRNRRPLELSADSGDHEVWVSIVDDGIVTRCHGLVSVSGGSDGHVLVRDRGCEGLTPGYGANTFFRGASVDFTLQGEVEAWVSVDGSRPLALPGMTFELNLNPGQHNIVLWTDNMQTAVFDQGTVTIGEGQRLPVTCTPGGCLGFEQAPVIIQINGGAPLGISGGVTTIDVNMPGLSVDIDANGMGASTSVVTPGGSVTTNGGSVTTNGGSAMSGSTNLSCCVNGAFYDCPSVDAVNTCSGNFMACMMNCGMMDMECPEKCQAEYPLDPSMCSRNRSGDSSCSQ